MQVFGQETTGRGLKGLAAKLELDWGATGNPAEVGREGAAVVEAAYRADAAALKGHIGATALEAGLDRDELIARVIGLKEVKFGDEPNAVYHLEKHDHELSPTEAAKGTRVNAYLESAKLTLKSGDAGPKVAQNGVLKLLFTRSFEEKVEGEVREYVMFAVVNVTEDGKVSLASYMNRGKKK